MSSFYKSFLKGFEKKGALVEWGVPHGKGGRLIPISFLGKKKALSVCVYSDFGLKVYPPAWQAIGVDLQKTFFIASERPIKDLQPLFLDGTFQWIILDAPKVLNKGELAFLSSQCRKNHQIVFLLRNYFLSRKLGNPLARYRINCFYNHRKDEFVLRFVKGFLTRNEIKIHKEDVINECST